MKPVEIASPCINICRMDGGLCVGCLRSLDEIARWSRAGEEDKRKILAAVARRREASTPLPAQSLGDGDRKKAI